MERQFEYGGYAVVARAVPSADGGFTATVVIADTFGEAPQPSFEEEAGVALTQEAAIALAEAAAMRAIDAGQVN
ncbi:hypothetical protein ACU4GI_27830 [Cupriavidus basilensis]|jgi:hypothetical protein|uniref:hypothetical protein n=1 Tax=Cupriavidus TaxID=106589 RepID=UPI00044BFF11|nr:hypothetical protein [Cupriavidus basilensis]MDF3882855.1 hypothetical protein [Cupriavidus basilensis]